MARRLLFAVLMLGSLTTLAHAGAFLGASVGQGAVNEDDPMFSFDETDTAYKVHGGFRFGKFFGLEASYVDLGNPEGDIGGGVTAEVGTTLWDGFVVLVLPLGDHFEIFGKGGFMYWDSEVDLSSGASASDSDSDPAYGVGVAFKFGDHLALRVEYELFEVGDLDDVYFTSAGLDFRF